MRKLLVLAALLGLVARAADHPIDKKISRKAFLRVSSNA
jgi:hypothetical protein